MAIDPNTPSFSRRRKWAIGFNVVLAVVTVIALVVMSNYLSGRYFKRFYFSSNTKVQLSSRTINLLHTITNKVQVTLYYDKDESLFSDVSELLKEYHSTNPKIVINTVDYYRDPGTAQEIKAKYNLGSSTNKNFIIFDSEGRTKIVDGKMLAQYTIEQVPNEKEREFRRKPVTFNGEMLFSGALLAVNNPKPLIAYYLQGHGEPSLTDTGESGYQSFANVLAQNYVKVQPLSLLGSSNSVPSDCNILIVAGVGKAIPEAELERIDQYLSQGGRMMALFDARSAAEQTGLEKVLAKWGVRVGADLVVDSEHMATGKDLVISAFSLHPAVNPVIGSGLYMVIPRPVSKDTNITEKIGIPVEEIAFTGESSYLYSDKSKQLARFAVMAAIDETTKGLVKERGATRMIIAGDSFFLNNRQIDTLSNRDFLNAAINWLGERNVLLEGVGPRPVTEFRLVVAKARMQNLQWILLGAVPGGILLFGGIVWLSRRK